MTFIEQHSRMSEKSPDMITTLVNHLNFDGMTKYSNAILLGRATEIPNLEPYKKSIPTSTIHNNSLPIQSIPTHLPGGIH